MKLPRSIQALIHQFEKLPGVGPKSAQRLTFYLLHVPEPEVQKFADALVAMKRQTTLCSQCHNVGENELCDVCDYSSRDVSLLCVVEQPLDVLAIERSGHYTGLYHVLHGAISPLNNIGPDQLYLNDITQRLAGVHEVVLATNPTMEGEATAMYIRQLISETANAKHITITRIGHGLPIGADIEYADGTTIARAMEGRREMA